MDGGFAYLVPMNLGFFALMFAGIYWYERRAAYTGWLALAYASGLIAALLDIAQPHSPLPRWDSSDYSYFFYWGMCLCVFVAMAIRFCQPIDVRIMAALVAVGLAGQLVVGYTHYNHGWQELFNNGLMATWLLMAARSVRRGGSGPVHRLVWGLLILIAITCMTKVVGIYLPGWLNGADRVALAEWHNLVQLLLSGVSANAAAMAMAAMAATDIIAIYRAEATTDPLTGLLNRRGLAEALDNSPTGSSGGGNHGRLTGYRLLFVDLDRFKAVNDRHGHLAGDMVLRRVATTIARVAQGHLLARPGGEEFLVLLRPHAAHQGEALAMLLWQALRTLDHPELGGARVTASIGISSLAGPSDNLDSLCASADRALYQAKQDGRDRVMGALAA